MRRINNHFNLSHAKTQSQRLTRCFSPLPKLKRLHSCGKGEQRASFTRCCATNKCLDVMGLGSILRELAPLRWAPALVKPGRSLQASMSSRSSIGQLGCPCRGCRVVMWLFKQQAKLQGPLQTEQSKGAFSADRDRAGGFKRIPEAAAAAAECV